MTTSDVAVTLIAKVFVMNGEDRILVMRRSKTDPRRPLTWDLPGGLVDYGEDPTEAVLRETEEEAGIKLEGVGILAVNSSNSDGYRIRFTYTGRSRSTAVKLSYEHDKYKWISLPELQDLDIPEPYKRSARLLESS